MGEYLREEGIEFTEVHISNAIRTQHTADLCLNKANCSLTVVVDPRLLEQSAGGWEGQSRDIYKRKDVRLALDTDNWNYIPGDDIPGESQKIVADRMLRWLESKLVECIASKRNHHIAVFTHALAIKFLLAELLNLDRSTAYSDAVNPIDNTSITQLCYTDETLINPIAKRNYRIC